MLGVRPSARWALRYASKPISKADILTMFSGPRVELVPAPGPGRVVCVADWALEYLFAGAAYTGTSTTVGPYYGASATAGVGTAFPITIGAAASAFNYRFGPAQNFATASVVNQPITFGCGTANPTDNGGAANGTAHFHVWYYILDLALL